MYCTYVLNNVSGAVLPGYFTVIGVSALRPSLFLHGLGPAWDGQSAWLVFVWLLQ